MLSKSALDVNWKWKLDFSNVWTWWHVTSAISIYRHYCAYDPIAVSIIWLNNAHVPPSPFCSLTSPNNAQLLWDEEEVQLENEKEEETAEGKEEGEVEELDYDESMEDLDLHPTGNIDEEGTCEASRLRGKSDERPG